MSPSGRPLRSLFVSASRDVWGVEVSLLRLAPLLVARGVEPELACPDGELAHRWTALGLPHVLVTAPAHLGLRRLDGSGRRVSPVALITELRASAAWASAVARAARGFDIVHSQSLWSHADVVLGARLRDVPVVVHVHDLVAPGIGRTVLGAAARRAAATMVISDAVRRGTGLDSARGVVVVHQGVDLDVYTPGDADPRVRAELSCRPDRPLIGIVGRMDPGKGVDIVVDAVGGLVREGVDAHLAVIGSSMMAPPGYVERLIGRATGRLGDRVRFVPPRTDIPDVLRALDVLVNASDAEPFGLTIVEAMAAGTPVVATSAGGALEIVDDGRSGLLFPVGDAGALAAQLHRLLTDGALRERIRVSARRRAVEGFDVEKYADEVIALYRAVSLAQDQKASSMTGRPARSVRALRPALATDEWRDHEETRVTGWSPEELERPQNCPVCGAPRQPELLHVDLVDYASGVPGRWGLRLCGSCGSAYLDPRPRRAAIGRAYSTYYTHHTTGGSPPSAWDRVVRRLHYGYLNANGYELAPASALGRWILPIVPGERDSAQRTVRHLRKPVAHPSLLDVGCGNGAFLDLMRWQGWRVTGIDPDPDAIATARRRGLDARVGTDEDMAELEERSFDAVSMHHVLEHSHAPATAVREAHRVLRTGGQLWVATPNLAAIGHARFGRDWRGLEPPRHLTLFTPSSLRLLLQDAGFEVTRRSYGRGLARWYSKESRALRRAREASVGAAPTGRLPVLDAVRLEVAEVLWSDRSEELALVARRVGG